MTYALITDGAVAQHPYSPAQLRIDNPGVSFPRDPSDDLLAEHGVVKVHASARPVHDPATQNVVASTPVFSGGQWVQGWEVEDATPDQIAERQQEANDIAAHGEVRADNFVGAFVEMTPAQVSTYIDNNTANLAATRALLKKMAVMLLILARREFR